MESTSAPVLEFDNVSVSFGSVDALRDVSLSVPEGASRVLLGVTGSGKSVLLKVAIGLVRPDTGAIRLFGEDIGSLPERELNLLRSSVGMVFQESALFDSLSIGENVAFPLDYATRNKPDDDEIEARVREALQFVELESTYGKFPSELSGGMRRRVAIARAFVTRPRLILCDSPTAGLDPITATTIMEVILKLRDTARVATVVTTHRLQDGSILANFAYDPDAGKIVPVVRSGDANGAMRRFWVLREGRIVFDGGAAELRSATDDYLVKFAMAGG